MTQQPDMDALAARVQQLYRLPPMPAIALRVMQMTAAPETTAAQLAGVIERDPSLAAQVLRYARSALFNYRGELHSVQEAVTRVLGFDRVTHLAVGIAASRSFELPRSGPLGLEAFWHHSLHCARLSLAIARRLPRGAARDRLDPELAYLSGLLHNLGLLLIGHLFPEDYRQLREAREAEPEVALSELEARIFGVSDQDEQAPLRVGHASAGGLLLHLWEMPEPVVTVAGMHEIAGYQGRHEPYVHCVQLANELLKERGIGDEQTRADPVAAARALGLNQPDLEQLLGTIDEVSAEIEDLARGLAA
ncbi:HDOD domain-containing protein [Salicola sp. Rm-C-2C1-2]|uniref:HDOD domain-containing protein n=1 Tax=Salicola sp. Rm-C-2C1-2 TaxID=3141321 RepID=UPI0032E518E1